jgi:hypothetical protein
MTEYEKELIKEIKKETTNERILTICEVLLNPPKEKDDETQRIIKEMAQHYTQI